MKFDLSLYLVTDPYLIGDRDLNQLVESAVKGGVTMVQLREKNCSSRRFLEKALQLKACLAPYGIPLIINDRLDIAIAADADGLHIGQSDLPWEVARKYLGSEKILGLSVENLEQAKDAADMNIDYIGISPVFSTPTKTDTAEPFGLEGITQVKNICPLPSVAIGGIQVHNVQDVLKAGTDGIAVVSAILGQEDPESAARQLKKLIDQTKA